MRPDHQYAEQLGHPAGWLLRCSDTARRPTPSTAAELQPPEDREDFHWFNFYRFSVSWPRVLPKGDLSVINQDGLDYYNNLINELVNNDTFLYIMHLTKTGDQFTMYHWDLPQHLQDLGGFANDIIIDYFEDYANLLFTHYGDRVKWWIKFNELLSFVNGYSSTKFAPAVNAPGVGLYLVGHNVLKAHARVYHLYDDHFRSQQRGKVSITLNMDYPMPKNNSEADINATEIYLQFKLGWFAHPIYSSEGDYPAVMKERVANNSRAEGLPRSRLPEFGEHWVKYIRGTHDFYGMNLYTANLISVSNTTADVTDSSNSDMGSIIAEQDPSWPYEGLNDFREIPDCLEILPVGKDNCALRPLYPTMKIQNGNSFRYTTGSKSCKIQRAGDGEVRGASI
ncbi:myrosinase 1-like [Bacillus rossius redtenbacheri]|uniref:myrosinase 1-like n=1 Tax=Bacillus rossius redtenbacheri TaxID=93214 RepID=UPI002FDD2A65